MSVAELLSPAAAARAIEAVKDFERRRAPDAAPIDGAPMAVGHRTEALGWGVRILLPHTGTIDLTKAAARALRDDIDLVLEAFDGKWGN